MNSPLPAEEACSAVRDVVLGRSSRVWQALADRPGLQQLTAIGHADLAGFAFTASDRVWVLSYSRDPQQNAAMLERLRAAGVHEIVYVSSSSTVVNELSRCYEYPRVKWQAEMQALALPQARVLTIGLMHESIDELPAGPSVATSFGELAAFIRQPTWPEGAGRRKSLLRVVERPFSGSFERRLHRAYGRVLGWLGPRPCLLRPVDLLLRSCGLRWYGYTYLSNRLWMSKMS